jgi:hypothetical protein
MSGLKARQRVQRRLLLLGVLCVQSAMARSLKQATVPACKQVPNMNEIELEIRSHVGGAASRLCLELSSENTCAFQLSARGVEFCSRSLFNLFCTFR